MKLQGSLDFFYKFIRIYKKLQELLEAVNIFKNLRNCKNS